MIAIGEQSRAREEIRTMHIVYVKLMIMPRRDWEGILKCQPMIELEVMDTYIYLDN